MITVHRQTLSFGEVPTPLSLLLKTWISGSFKRQISKYYLLLQVRIRQHTSAYVCGLLCASESRGQTSVFLQTLAIPLSYKRKR
jgi:hypothetical protein